jgi:hypothetical protein
MCQFRASSALKVTAFWDTLPCSLVEGLMIEVVSTSETSIYFYETTRRNIPEGCHLHTRRREKLKSWYAVIAYIV